MRRTCKHNLRRSQWPICWFSCHPIYNWQEWQRILATRAGRSWSGVLVRPMSGNPTHLFRLSIFSILPATPSFGTLCDRKSYLSRAALDAKSVRGCWQSSGISGLQDRVAVCNVECQRKEWQKKIVRQIDSPRVWPLGKADSRHKREPSRAYAFHLTPS